MRLHAANAVVLFAAFGLTLLAIRAFALLLAGPHFPWSEDAAGHVYKSTVLIESLRAGHGVPILFPGWYAGSEAFRYWPHLPYFLLAIPLALAPSDPGLAVIAIIAAALAASGAGVLLWRRRLGWPLTILGAVLAALLADPLRVAFAEGNLPRVVAHALFLPELALALAVARADRWHPWPRPALALIAVAMVSLLSHAMMATAAGAAIVLVLLAGNLTGRWAWRRTLAVAGLIAIGTALAGWWLVPSLGGGITATSGEAVRRGLFHFDIGQSFDALAYTDIKINANQGRAHFYTGPALVLAAVAALVHGGRRGGGWPYLIAGLGLVLTAIDPFALLYIRLPFANLLWPIRLQSVGQVLILLGLLHTAADVLRAPIPVTTVPRRWARAATVGLLCLVALDSAGNLALIAGRPTPVDQLMMRDRLASTPGWREATLDLSRLGSPPTLLWREREQLFGWGIQGARNITEIVDLNEALERDLTRSVLSRLDWWGVDDAVLDKEDSEIEAALAGHGFALRGTDDKLRHWGRDGGPRALTLGPAVAIGTGKNIRAWTPRFPQIVRAESEFIDDLRLEDLQRHATLVLAWPQWRDRGRAEALVRDYAASGGRVIVELAANRAERADGTSRFLGVEATRVPFPEGGVAIEDRRGGDTRLVPFDPNEGTWLATRYAGEIEPEGTVRLSDGDAAVVIGTSTQNERIMFIGANLAFHALLTSDPAADRILQRTGALDRSVLPIAGTIPISDYTIAGSSYRFAITNDRAQRLVIPIARHERMTGWLDGTVIRIGALNDAVVLDVPAGRHEFRLEVDEGGNRVLGYAISLTALVATVGLIVLARRPVVRRKAIRSHGWLIALKEAQRVDEIAIGPAAEAGDGPFVVVLAEVTNLGKIARPFDPSIVVLVGRHGRPFVLARTETDVLAAALGQLRPGEDAEPAVPRLASLVYSVPLIVAEDFELIAERDAARSW